MSERALNAYIDDHKIGRLVDANGVWSFTYAPEWLESRYCFALGPGLPLQSEALIDGSSVRPVQWYFDNLLPEEGQRLLLAKDAKIDAADAFGLLAYYGRESAGSLSLYPGDDEISQDNGLKPLTNADLNNRISEMPRLPLTHKAAKKMSLAGAQHKLPVTVEDGKLHEPFGRTPSSHILKPDHPDPDFPHSVINEYFVMQLARRLKLDVPEVQRLYVPAPVYLINRFDRRELGGSLSRIHCIDACQLLGLDKSYKYIQGSVDRLADLANLCRNKPQARMRLFEWLIYLVLTGNGDAHLKNISFIVTHEEIRVAPYYDLLSTAVYETKAFGKEIWPNDSAFAWPIMGITHFRDIDRHILLEAGMQIGLSRETAERAIQRLTSRIIDEATSLLEGIYTQNHLSLEADKSIGITFAGEERCLRAVIEVVIKEMVTKLS